MERRGGVRKGAGEMELAKRKKAERGKVGGKIEGGTGKGQRKERKKMTERGRE